MTNYSAEKMLLDAAGRLFRERGVAGATVRSIADAADLLPGSLHYRYSTKDELLVALMKRGLDDARVGVRRAISRSRDPAERLRLAMRDHLTRLTTGDDAVYVNLYEWRALNQEGRDRIGPLRDAYESLWTGLLLEAEGAGMLRPGLNIRLVRLLILGALNWVAQWYSEDDVMSPKQIADAFWTMLEYGILDETRRDPKSAARLFRRHASEPGMGDEGGDGEGGSEN